MHLQYSIFKTQNLPVQPLTQRTKMPKFIIEREIADAGKLTQEDLTGISQKSCSILKTLYDLQICQKNWGLNILAMASM